MFQCNGNRELRETVQEIGSPVERVDDPDRVRITARAGLLGENRVLRVVFLNDVDNRALGGMIGVIKPSG